MQLAVTGLHVAVQAAALAGCWHAGCAAPARNVLAPKMLTSISSISKAVPEKTKTRRFARLKFVSLANIGVLLCTKGVSKLMTYLLHRRNRSNQGFSLLINIRDF